MKKALARKILALTTLALLVFAGISMVVVNIMNIRANGQVLELAAEPYVTEARMASDTADLIERLGGYKYHTIRVTYIKADGVPIYDSKYEVDILGNQLGFKEVEKAVNGEDNITVRRSDEEKSDVILYATVISGLNLDDIDTLIVRVSTRTGYDSNYFLLMIPIVLGVLLVVAFVSVAFTNSVVKRAVAPLGGIYSSLVNINKGQYTGVAVESKYEEIKKVVDEINTVSQKIAGTIGYLEYEQQKNTLLLKSMRQGVIALTKTGTILLTNAASQIIFRTDKNVLGCDLSYLIEDEKLVANIKHALENNSAFLGEYRLFDNVYRVEVTRINEKWFEEFRGLAAIALLTDISTESKSSEIRSEFFANASHELKTPLTSIKGFAEVAGRSTNADNKDMCIAEIEKNAIKMTQLIDDMLKLSKMEASIYEQELEVVNLAELTEDVIRSLAPIAAAKSVTVSFSGSGSIYGAHKRIEEVLTNLIDNSIKYNVDGGTVDVNIGEENGKVKLVVRDSGIGIDSKHINRVFERFYRVDKGRDRKINSTGLGLAIVKHIVQMHHGSIELTSAPGKGTAVTLIFDSAI